ncbi:hypothetical protein Q428_00290 [Fervidicella metallireducens AeB]|uniref:Uncharacterized protein n=1 Tax=Fervidicella metallireducens AeB TaxID=1403537 RepID=A0A017RYL1_9CLOT|nr:hypothetical protein [Fervidicella metallireducens]EYE89868.1 hypothetical protein Q428_00290 [Fervidicella metallireducens AeB]
MINRCKENVEKLGFVVNYNNTKELIENEIIPLSTLLQQLSTSIYNMTFAADAISNINVTETHQIKELLELAYDLRRLSERVECVLKNRTDIALKAIDTGVYDYQNLYSGIEKNVPDCQETQTEETIPSINQSEDTNKE